MTKRALISVYDKNGLEEFARGLIELGWELTASGDTTEAVSSFGLKVASAEETTKSEKLTGRFKTLHPAIHAAILARRDREDDVAALSENSIEPFDLVCVNFYPFATVVARYGPRGGEDLSPRRGRLANRPVRLRPGRVAPVGRALRGDSPDWRNSSRTKTY